MTNNTTCNGWRNRPTWLVNLWFGDKWADDAEQGYPITADGCEEDVRAYVDDVLQGTTSGFIEDMLDLRSVDWNELAEAHAKPDPEDYPE